MHAETQEVLSKLGHKACKAGGRDMQHLCGFATSSVSADNHHVVQCQLGQQVLTDTQHRQAGPVLLPLGAFRAVSPALQAVCHVIGFCLLLLGLLAQLW